MEPQGDLGVATEPHGELGVAVETQGEWGVVVESQGKSCGASRRGRCGAMRVGGGILTRV